MELSTIKLHKTTVRMLDQLKIHPRESRDQLIRRLLRTVSKDRLMELSNITAVNLRGEFTTIWVRKETKEALKRIKSSDLDTYEDVLLRLIKASTIRRHAFDA